MKLKLEEIFLKEGKFKGHENEEIVPVGYPIIVDCMHKEDFNSEFNKLVEFDGAGAGYFLRGKPIEEDYYPVQLYKDKA